MHALNQGLKYCLLLLSCAFGKAQKKWLLSLLEGRGQRGSFITPEGPSSPPGVPMSVLCDQQAMQSVWTTCCVVRLTHRAIWPTCCIQRFWYLDYFYQRMTEINGLERNNAFQKQLDQLKKGSINARQLAGAIRWKCCLWSHSKITKLKDMYL